MALAYSKLTAQGQISVPSKVRTKLGVGPGGVLEWDEEDGKIVVRRAGRFSSQDLHSALFPKGARLGFSDCLVLEAARKAGHLPLGTFDRELGKLEGAQKL